MLKINHEEHDAQNITRENLFGKLTFYPIL